jgi:hypothetical protein
MANDAASILLFNATDLQRAVAARRAERYNLAVNAIDSADDLLKQAKSKTNSVLLLGNFQPDSHNAARALRKLLKNLPIFAVVPDQEIQGKTLALANTLQIELLPTSMPEARRWEKLKEACETSRSGKRRTIVNRRAHFRLPLKVKATLINTVETVDISLGGIAFLSNTNYALGDVGKIDIRSLLGDMDEDERGFKFEVVSVKRMREGEHKLLIGGKFVDLSQAARQRLKSALELIEPTGEEIV